MQKKILIPVISILLLLVVLVGVMMMDSSPDKGDSGVSSASMPEDVASAEVKGYLIDIDADSITGIDIRSGEQDFGFVSVDDKWHLAGNLSASISSGSVDSLVNSLSSIGYVESYSQSEMKRSDCGISESSDGIVVSTENADGISLSRGINTTDGKFTYMASSLDSNIYLIPIETAERLFAPLENYRNSAMLSLDFDNILEIDLKSENGAISLKKGKANANNAVYNEWKLASPIEVGASDEYVKSKLIDPLKQIKIVGYASDYGDFDAFGFGAKDKYISLKDSNGKLGKVYFSSQTGGKYYIAVNDEPTIYEIAISDAPYIGLKAIDVADRNINLAKMVNIQNVTIKGTDIDYNIEFLDKNGKINGSDVSYDDMNQKIFPSVCGLFADDIINGESGGAELVIVYNYKDGSSDKLKFASYNDRLYSVSKNGKLMYLILKTKISDLTAKLDEYK